MGAATRLVLLETAFVLGVALLGTLVYTPDRSVVRLRNELHRLQDSAAALRMDLTAEQEAISIARRRLQQLEHTVDRVPAEVPRTRTAISTSVGDASAPGPVTSTGAGSGPDHPEQRMSSGALGDGEVIEDRVDSTGGVPRRIVRLEGRSRVRKPLADLPSPTPTGAMPDRADPVERPLDKLYIFQQEKDAVLVLITLKDVDSWGISGRSVADFLTLVRNLTYPRHKMSLGFLISDKKEFDKTYKYIKDNGVHHEFAAVTMIHETFDALDGFERWKKYRAEVQPSRRRIMAMARNYLVFTALREEEYILWIDADMTGFPFNNMLNEMIESGKDIITPACHIGDRTDYDWNSWKGKRKYPDSEQMAAIKNKTYHPFFEPGIIREQAKIVDDYRKEDPEQKHKFQPLDSVGGTVLFLKADVHRKGALFSPLFIIGAQWEHHGWDAIETESLCYAAQSLDYTCWAMPHTYVIHHW